MKYCFLILSVVVLSRFPLYSQSDRKLVRDGNALYQQKKFGDAEKKYNAAIAKNKDAFEPTFNLADALYKQEKYEEASNLLMQLPNKTKDKELLSKAYHNLGNSLLKSKKYEESIKAYQQALKNNSKDQDTKYNLSYAKQMLQQQQQQNKDDKDKKDEKKDQQQKQNQENKDDKKENKDQQQQQQQKMNKEDAKRMLEAVNNKEKEVHDKMKKKKTVGVKGQIEKDW